MSKKIKLNKAEKLLALYVSETRDWEMKGTNTHLMGLQTPHANLLGVSGEIAFNKMINQYYNPEQREAWDVKYKGKLWDVKCNDNQHQTCFINPKCIGKGNDGFVYMHTDDLETFEFIGRISEARLVKDFTVKAATHSDAYILNAEDFD